MAELIQRINDLKKTLERIHEGEYDADSRDARYWLADLIEALEEIAALKQELRVVESDLRNTKDAYAWARVAADDRR